MEKKIENEMETREYVGIRGHIGIYWGYMGIMAKRMEITITGVI